MFALIIHVWQKAWVFIAGVATTVIMGFASQFVIKSLSGPDTYHVWLVGDYNNSEDKAKTIIDAVNNAKKQDKDRLEIGGVPVDFQKWQSDEKTAATVSEELAGRNDTLMVIGHFNSTATAKALPYYMKAKPPVPIIVANDTVYSELPPKDPDDQGGYRPMFRLSPSVEDEAKIAVEFINGKNPPGSAIWVVEDAVWNPVYTRDLAQKFIEQLHGSGVKHHESEPEPKNSNKVLLWTTNRELPLTDAIKSLHIRWVFFPGNWSDCLILIRVVNEMSSPNPKMKDLGPKLNILLGHSCASQDLLDDARAGQDELKNVYLLHPLCADEFNKKGGFAVYGGRAYALFRKLYDKAQSRELGHGEGSQIWIWNKLNSLVGVVGFHSVTKAREELRVAMEQAANPGNPEKFTLDGATYEFNPDGTPKDLTFHVWKIDNYEFKDVSSCSAG